MHVRTSEVKHFVNDPQHIGGVGCFPTPNLNTIGHAVPEIQKRGVHVRTCVVPPPGCLEAT